MKFVKAVEFISRSLSYITLFLLLIMMLLMSIDVFMRIVFNAPIVGALEISQMLMVSMILATPRCALEHRHLKVTLVLEHLSKKAVRRLDYIVLSATFLVSAILAWQSAETALYLKQINKTYSLLRVPYYPFLWIMAIGFAVLCLAIIALILRRKAEVTPS